MMTATIVFTIPGAPQGKGRAKSSSRIGRDPRTGAPRVFTRHYTPEKTASYESLVKLAAAQAMAGREPYTGPIRMDLDIVLPIPASWSGVRQRRAAAGEIAPTTKPDSDNVEKAVKDGINGIVYRDDVQVVQDSKRKVYGAVPGVTVRVTVLEGMEPAQGVKKNA
ncbi:RusA family crossover junction endodeoxyribonuclease [Bordetella hinzii]|uniref:RusA family crossover junction endodeoxyribonuclease n=1 Tax=Bordetella hinzii TaxID=103855 RepID=UPI00123871D2|nr:RusA family crossover junction endodeoxyribonuclease [Bordetella hinzii]MBZ0073637.1 RusA family crossover junction endodeoxyribonuclease [Bordetella hinzii]MBZ0077887.1 RusA family crossover junction endodeoxyribonuclease [Bordetella hinzii]MBZ0082434.1 RusA family crossover junction endodeoxyribonuclease [Bordetella hinzii]QET42180.1 RusA family crossover junction endodeoxyribonuclease [Bordetella hinzii]